jgi:purine-binding chemotaxis protein CheW
MHEEIVMEIPVNVESAQYLIFRIANEDYAIGVLRVREIIQYENTTMVPMTPSWIRGVINLRGSVVPVVDLALKFGLSESPITATSCIVIVEVDVEGEATIIGVMADHVSEVILLTRSDIEPPPPFCAGIRVDYLRGIGKVGNVFVLVLDIDRILNADELMSLMATEATASLQDDAKGGDEAQGAQAGLEARP